MPVDVDMCFCLYGEVPGVLKIHHRMSKSAFDKDNSGGPEGRLASSPPPLASILSQPSSGGSVVPVSKQAEEEKIKT